MSQQPDGSWLDITEMPRKQLEEEYMRTQYALTRILKGTELKATPNPNGEGHVYSIMPDTRPSNYRIYYSQDGEVLNLHLRAYP